MTPTTHSGVVLLDVHPFDLTDERFPMLDAILAIEAEAAAAERARLAEAVRGLEIKDDTGDNWDRPVVCGHIDGPCGFRVAVIALLEPAP